jgi:hypothetical protein
MKSNICKIAKGTTALDGIFTESEKVAKYNDLNHKETLQLRLLCEELVGMLPSIISDFSGEFWIENRDSDYELCLKVLVDDMDIFTRERLVKVSKNNKNSSVVGITGKIRAVFDYMVMSGNDTTLAPAGKYGFYANVDYTQIWSLHEYRESVKDESDKSGEAWDEFERSILVKLADDVIVGVKGKTANIIIKKRFA